MTTTELLNNMKELGGWLTLEDGDRVVLHMEDKSREKQFKALLIVLKIHKPEILRRMKTGKKRRLP